MSNAGPDFVCPVPLTLTPTGFFQFGGSCGPAIFLTLSVPGPFYFFYPRIPGMTSFLSISKHCRNKNKRDNLIKLVLFCLAIPPLWLRMQ
jgi:hypothetical protein